MDSAAGGADGFRRAMDALCEKYRSDRALALDPISIPLEHKDSADRELASWAAAHLAYGRVAPMMGAIRRLMAPLGPRPAAWLREMGEARIRGELGRSLPGWAWRFHTLSDMAEWLVAWKRLDESTGHSGVEPLLAPDGRESADARLSALVNALRRDLPRSRGIRFNLPDPLEGAACKRWRMFLRWMARSGWPDFGIWEKYPASALVVPLDTHVHRISIQMGICRRRAADAKAAHEITAALRELDPADPLKYDFALAHLGILGDCTGERRPRCLECPLETVCGPGTSP
jgi:uncharacterized protein (TIGR02757 family)